jgi:RNA polymerase sigma factor (sigma-70 family)
MPTSQMSEVIQHLRRAGLLQDAAEVTDGELLKRFVSRREPGALEALVRRHGPMVWGVCRRILGDAHDAEDAFQATFLVLVRRAASVRANVGSWLYGVAHRTALKARANRAKRQARERSVTGMPEPAGTDQEVWDDLQPLLDQELSRLPEKYRAVLVLRDLEGKTGREAARQLGCPEGTAASRLARARAMLARRLARRGLALSGGALAAALSHGAASASVPAPVLSATLKAVTLVAAGQAAAAGAVSGTVAVLTEGVLKAMFLNKLMKVTAALLLLATVGTGVWSGGWAAGPAQADRPNQPKKARPGAAVPAAPARPVDRDAWARKLAALNEATWRTAFAVGQELAALPADEGLAILRANWQKVGKVEARQQLLKAWAFARHPRLVDGMDLGMRDRSPDVQRWATFYLNDVAFQDFAEDFPAYKDWYQANRDRPLPEVAARSARRFAAESARSARADAEKRARWFVRHMYVLRDVPAARRALLDAGFLRTLERWASGATRQSQPEDIERVTNAVRAFGQLQPPAAELKRVVVPLLASERPAEVRAAAISALGGRPNAWATDLLLGVLQGSLGEDRESRQTITWAAAGALASHDDPRVIPTMIAVIGADNTYDTVYGVGHFGLGPLTGVEYDKAHDGAWWRRWWEKNKERYPEAVRALEGPKVSKGRQRAAQAPAAPPADEADVPAQDLRAGGDEKKRYFLIGAKDARPPAAGWGLLIVLPGGDGSADFQPFIRNIYRKLHKDVLHDRWLVAQAVAPKWDEDQFDQIVWPTATSGYPAAKFTTEKFIRAIVADVRARVKVDGRRVLLLGWSSGGPPCYAAALRKDSVVTGAFVAMSVFRPEQLPPLKYARGRAFYLLQSPQDRVTPLGHALAAEAALRAAGAKVRLRRYDGGHGWHGDVWRMIGDGITWLEQQAGAE